MYFQNYFANRFIKLVKIEGFNKVIYNICVCELYQIYNSCLRLEFCIQYNTAARIVHSISDTSAPHKYFCTLIQNAHELLKTHSNNHSIKLYFKIKPEKVATKVCAHQDDILYQYIKILIFILYCYYIFMLIHLFLLNFRHELLINECLKTWIKQPSHLA